MRKIVHISGYSLAENSHEAAMNRAGEPISPIFGDLSDVWWGNGLMGRIPMGLWLARTLDADSIVWSTGATRRASDGKSEARLMLEMAQDRYFDLHGQFPHRFSKLTWRTQQAYHSWLDRVSMLEERSRDTLESMHELHRRIKDSARRSERMLVYLVSSANHIPRVLRDAEIVFGIGTETPAVKSYITLFAVPAETNYGGKSVQNTIVRDLGT